MGVSQLIKIESPARAANGAHLLLLGHAKVVVLHISVIVLDAGSTGCNLAG